MRFGPLMARAVAADSVVNGTTNPHSCHAKAEYDIPDCDSVCKQRIAFAANDNAARTGVSLALTAYTAREWCFKEHEDWCPATIDGTVNMIARRLLNETLPTLGQDSCGQKCLINTLANSTQKATYWAGKWAQGMFKNASEPLVVNQTALGTFEWAMKFVKLLPAESVLNDTAFADLACSHAPSEPSNGPQGGSDDDGDDHAKDVSLGAGLGVGLGVSVPLIVLTAAMGFTPHNPGYRLFKTFAEKLSGPGEMFKKPSWLRELLDKRSEQALDQAIDIIKMKATEVAEAAQPLAEEFEEAFQELAPWEAPFGARLFHTEVFNHATGAMENGFLMEDLSLGPSRVPASLSKQGYRMFYRVDHTGEMLQTASGKWAESYHKPSELKPVDNEYWQGVKSQAEAALEGTTQILRTTSGIVLDSIGQPVVAVNGIQAAIQRVGNDAERIALRFTHSTTQLFDKDEPPNVIGQGAGVVGGLFNGAGNILSMFASHPGGPMDEAELTTEEKWNKGSKGPAIVPAGGGGGGNSSTTASTGLGSTSTSSSNTVSSTSTSSASHNSTTVPASTSSPLTSSTSISSSMTNSTTTNSSTMTSSSMTGIPTTNSSMTTSTPMTNSSTFTTSTSLPPGWASNWTSTNVMTLTATEYLSTVTLSATTAPTLTPSMVMMTMTEYLTSVTATRWHSGTPSPTSTSTGTAAALK